MTAIDQIQIDLFKMIRAQATLQAQYQAIEQAKAEKLRELAELESQTTPESK
jgi:hypothetical protein